MNTKLPGNIASDISQMTKRNTTSKEQQQSIEKCNKDNEAMRNTLFKH